MERRIPSLVSWWPISPAKIDETLTRDSITAEVVRESFAADQRGFGAIEYLLFADDDAVLGQLESGSSAFGQYLTSLAAVIADAIQQAADDWSGAYGDAFAGRGDRVIAERLAIADFVRVPVFLIEAKRDCTANVCLGGGALAPRRRLLPRSPSHTAQA